MRKMPKTVQSVNERLAEINRVIINTSHDACELMKRNAPASEIDSITGFMDELFKRREVILWELRKAETAAANGRGLR